MPSFAPRQRRKFSTAPEPASLSLLEERGWAEEPTVSLQQSPEHQEVSNAGLTSRGYDFGRIGILPAEGNPATEAPADSLLEGDTPAQHAAVDEPLAVQRVDSAGQTKLTGEGLTTDALINEADTLESGSQLTKAGRALSKHSVRTPTAFGPPTNRKGMTPTLINTRARDIVREILEDAGSTVSDHTQARYGRVLDIIAPDGRGVRFKIPLEFVGFLEPPVGTSSPVPSSSTPAPSPSPGSGPPSTSPSVTPLVPVIN